MDVAHSDTKKILNIFLNDYIKYFHDLKSFQP